jgi:hypothetical protein
MRYAPHMVIPTPRMFSGVSSSPNSQAEIEMVVTSFAIPAMDMGTTPARRRMLHGDVLAAPYCRGAE